MKTAIHVGLMLDSFLVPRWFFYVLKNLQNSNNIKIKLIVINGTKILNNSNLISKFIRNHNYFLYKFYMKFENAFFQSESNPLDMVDVTDLLQDIPSITVVPKQTKFSDRLDENDVLKIKNYNLDVLFRFGFRIIRGSILSAAKFGIWSYHHGDILSNRGGPAGFWEVLQNQSITGSTLQILNEDLDGGTILYKSYSNTDNHSVNRNRVNYYWKSADFIERKLNELYLYGEKNFFDTIKKFNEDLNFYDNKLYSIPTNKEMFKLMTKHFIKLLKSKFHSWFYFDQWILMFDIGDKVSKSFWRYKEMIPPKDRFWADPQIIYLNEKYYVFFEEYFYKQKKGHISLIIFDKNGNFSQSKKILEQPYHLSYPFVFQYAGDFYLIPETYSKETIEVYKCDVFPYKWHFHKILIDNICAVDSTIFYYGDKWWLFAGVSSNKFSSPSEELCLFFSDDPINGKWKPHPHNPVVSDVRKARPAGKIFELNGNIYRPSQNCSINYGHGVIFNKIITLNEYDYHEVEVQSLESNWNTELNGFHTFNYCDGLSIIDVLKKRKR